LSSLKEFIKLGSSGVPSTLKISYPLKGLRISSITLNAVLNVNLAAEGLRLIAAAPLLANSSSLVNADSKNILEVVSLVDL